MTMKYLPLAGTHMEAQNQKKNLTYLAWSVNYGPKALKIPIFENTTSRHANFTKVCRIVTIDVKNKP